VCVQDFSVLGSCQTEPSRGAGKFIVMAISTFHYEINYDRCIRAVIAITKMRFSRPEWAALFDSRCASVVMEAMYAYTEAPPRLLAA